MRAVGYFRVSTDKEEQKQSLKNQEDLFLNAIKDRDYILHAFYVDVQSGTSGKRPNFIRMIEDAEKGLFDIIIVKEFSRLARNSELASRIKRIAENNSVRIISLDGQIDTFDNIKNENFGLYAWLYEKEAQQTSTRIKAVFQTKQRAGKFLGATPPYGYLVVDKKLVPRDDYTEDVVKMIYAKFLEGWGQDKIARELSKLGYITPLALLQNRGAGKFWHGSTIKKILVNHHYLGHLVQHRETTISVVNRKRKKVPIEEQIWVYNTHRPLIDEVTFNLVQQKIESKMQNGKVKRYLNNRHLLTGFLYCSDCGAALHYLSNRQGYICSAYAKHGNIACTNHAIREEHVLTLIKNDLKGLFSIDINSIDFNAKIDKTKQKAENAQNRLSNKVENLKSKNKKYLDMLIDEIISQDDYKLYIDINAKEIETLQQEIDKMKASTKVKRPDLNEIRSKIVKIANLEIFDRELLNMLIDRIEIKENGALKVLYTFNAPVSECNYKDLKSS